MGAHQTEVYETNELFKYLKKVYKLRSDQALGRWLAASAPTISRICNGKRSLTPKMILYIYDNTDLKIEEIRALFKQKIPKQQ
jgi:plasmid maintenance system antidote protein VapI